MICLLLCERFLWNQCAEVIAALCLASTYCLLILLLPLPLPLPLLLLLLLLLPLLMLQLLLLLLLPPPGREAEAVLLDRGDDLHRRWLAPAAGAASKACVSAFDESYGRRGPPPGAWLWRPSVPASSAAATSASTSHAASRSSPLRGARL